MRARVSAIDIVRRRIGGCYTENKQQRNQASRKKPSFSSRE
ncbi:hypothetical protein QUA83_19445 [Microcoleus sp. K1-B1]